MLKKVKVLIVSLGAIFAVATPALVAHATDAGNIDNTACGIELQTNGCTKDSVSAESGEGKIIGIVKVIINVLSLLVGSVCIIMIIFGGFKYLTSGGESAGVTGAKNTILYAVVGLVIVLLAQAIVRFVFTRTVTTPA